MRKTNEQENEHPKLSSIEKIKTKAFKKQSKQKRFKKYLVMVTNAAQNLANPPPSHPFKPSHRLALVFFPYLLTPGFGICHLVTRISFISPPILPLNV